jgi:hypothetical protein
MAEDQNFKNHGRLVPMFHGGVFLPLLVNFVWALYRLSGGFTGDAVVNLLVAVALLLMASSVRTQILTVQDRVIRLEMRHRFREILPAELAVQAAALPVKQVVALRFASDAELPALVREVVGGTLPNGKAIKTRVRDWQADHLRA